MRTDKKGDALLGAMQYAHQHGVDRVMTDSLIPEILPTEIVNQPLLVPLTVPNSILNNPQTLFQDVFNLMKNTIQQVGSWASWFNSQVEEGVTLVGDGAAWFNSTMEEAVEQILQTPESLMSYPIAPARIEDLQYYIDSPLYEVDKDPEIIANYFHPEAVSAYRIYRMGQISGNQALYDSSGNLIGTSPDIVSPSCDIVLHLVFDVIPFFFPS